MATHTHTVALEDLRTVLFAHKVRRRASTPLASFAVMTAPALFEVDCSNGRTPPQSTRQYAMRMASHKARVQPLQRGHIGRLFDRVQARGRRAEVLRTWHTGIGHLRREPQYTLHLPLPQQESA